MEFFKGNLATSTAQQNLDEPHCLLARIRAVYDKERFRFDAQNNC